MREDQSILLFVFLFSANDIVFGASELASIKSSILKIIWNF